jgi:hypothetical protein
VDHPVFGVAIVLSLIVALVFGMLLTRALVAR